MPGHIFKTEEIFLGGARKAQSVGLVPKGKTPAIVESSAKMPRGTSNSNARGNSKDRAARKRWLLQEFGDGVEAPCCFCGCLLDFETITVERIIPGCQGGRYVRKNCKPACGLCNSTEGGRLRSTPKDYSV